METTFDIGDIRIARKPKKGGSGDGKGKPGKPGEGKGQGEEENPTGDPIRDELDKRGGDDHTPHSEEDAEKPDPDAPEPTIEDIERVSKRARPREPDEKAEKPEEKASGKAVGDLGGRGTRMDPNASRISWKDLKPRFNWKTLLARLVRSSDTLEPTYQKMHRRNISNMHVAAQTGAGAVKPGEKMVPSSLVKLCLVIDSSGSMHHHIPMVMATITKLLTENASSIDRSFAIVEFSGDSRIYCCTMSGAGKGVAVRITGVEGMRNPTGEHIPLSAIMERHIGGSTNFDEELTGKLRGFLADKYNVLILTDSDIVAAGNKQEFLKLYNEHRDKVYLIVDSHMTFAAIAEALSQASANVSHM